MIAWLKRMLSLLRARKKVDHAVENLPTEHADTSNYIPLDPKNDPWGRS